MPRDDLPVVLDPARGWLATANNTVLPPDGEQARAVVLGGTPTSATAPPASSSGSRPWSSGAT